MMRRACLFLGVIAIGVVGCNAIAGLGDDFVFLGGAGSAQATSSNASSSGSGGTASAGGIGGTGGTGGTGGIGGCMQASDCPDTMNGCVLATCTDTVCGAMNAADQAPSSVQVTGDCKMNVCDGAGMSMPQDDDADINDDAKECTTDTCMNGSPVHANVASGTPCTENGGKKCNASGACVQCVDALDCTQPDICQNGMCNPLGCANAMKDGTETDIDCGGAECNPCGTNKNCMVAADCVSLVCTGNKCQAALCTDMVKNGTETDVDCGGAGCPGCAENKVCAVGSDCESGVCTGGTCKAPTCMDGVKNGTETDIDCGGGACPTCADTKACAMNSDCTSNNCVNMVCEPSGAGGMDGAGGN